MDRILTVVALAAYTSAMTGTDLDGQEQQCFHIGKEVPATPIRVRVTDLAPDPIVKPPVAADFRVLGVFEGRENKKAHELAKGADGSLAVRAGLKELLEEVVDFGPGAVRNEAHVELLRVERPCCHRLDGVADGKPGFVCAVESLEAGTTGKAVVGGTAPSSVDLTITGDKECNGAFDGAFVTLEVNLTIIGTRSEVEPFDSAVTAVGSREESITRVSDGAPTITITSHDDLGATSTRFQGLEVKRTDRFLTNKEGPPMFDQFAFAGVVAIGRVSVSAKGGPDPMMSSPVCVAVFVFDTVLISLRDVDEHIRVQLKKGT